MLAAQVAAANYGDDDHNRGNEAMSWSRRAWRFSVLACTDPLPNAIANDHAHNVLVATRELSAFIFRSLVLGERFQAATHESADPHWLGWTTPLLPPRPEIRRG